MTRLLDMAAPPWCLCASDSLIQGHHMQEAPSYVLCSLQRGIPSRSLPREGLLSLNRPQRKLPSARPWDGRTETFMLAMGQASRRCGHNGEQEKASQPFFRLSRSGILFQIQLSISNQKRRKSEAQPLPLIHLPQKALSEL